MKITKFSAMAVLLMLALGNVGLARAATGSSIPIGGITSVFLGDAKADLQAYYDEVLGYYNLMTDTTYDDSAFTQEQREALAAALDAAKSALESGSGDYAALQSSLRAVYERVPYVEGGQKWWLIKPADLKDGSLIMLECGPTDYNGKYVTAYPANANQNAVMCDDNGKSTAALWQLVATGDNDAIYTSKPTYYLKHVSTQKYFGVSSNLQSIDQGHKRMVDATDMAYAFCFLTAKEINAEEGISINTYGNNDAVFVHHSNADGTWFRLSRFGAYKQVYYISTNVYPTNTMWQAWNLYTGEANLNISGELQQAIESYATLKLPAGTVPGYYDSTEVAAYEKAVDFAKAITPSNSRQEYRAAIDSLSAAYSIASNLVPIPLSEGYYRIVSAYSNFTSAGKTMCAFDYGNGYLGWHTMDSSQPINVFKITATDGGWYVSNCATDKYVGVAIDANKITMTDTPSSVQIFTSQGLGQWKWKNTTTSYTYYTNGSDPGYMGRYYSQNSLNAFDAWMFEPVSEQWVASATTGPARDSLSVYYNWLVSDVEPYVNAEDYAPDKVEAFSSAMAEAKSALTGASTLTAGEYKALLASLKDSYNNLGFAMGGGVEIMDRIAVSNIGDGSTIAIEAASTPALKDYFLKGQTAYSHALYAWVFKSGLDLDGVWDVESANATDLKNGKPTYYLKQHSTGLYIGKNGPGTTAYQTRALVQTTDSAYNFSILTPQEAGCTTYQGKKNWDSQSVVFQYANTPTQAFNLCNWAYSPSFVWLFEGSTDVIAWNAYEVEISTDLFDEYDKIMARCLDFQPQSDGGIGFYDPILVANYYAAYNAAKDMTSDNSRLEYRNAIDSLRAAYVAVKGKGLTPVQSGYYYLTNSYSGYVDANGAPAGLKVDAADGNVGYAEFDKEKYNSIVHLTGNSGAWYIQHFATKKFLTRGSGSALTISETRGSTFDFSVTNEYQANMRLSGNSQYYCIGSAPEGNLATTISSKAAAAQWSLVRVDEDALVEFMRLRSGAMLRDMASSVVEYYNSLGSNQYSETAEAEFKSAYEQARDLSASDDASQHDYDEAYSNLTTKLVALKDSRIYEEGSPLQQLALYVRSIKDNIPHISAQYYDAQAVANLIAAWSKATDAVEKEDLDDDGYTNTLSTLRNAYDAVGYVYGGYYPRVKASELVDGAEIMIEAASSEYTLGSYLKPGNVVTGNNSTLYTTGRDSSCVWRLVDAGKIDKLNGKTTYYLQNKKSGLYIGYSGNYAKALVSATDKAMNFSIITKADISFSTYLDGTSGSDDNSVAFQFSKDDGYIRLGNFVAYGDYVYNVTASWTHVIAWNLYSAQLRDDIRGEYAEAMKSYGQLRVESGDDPGCYTDSVANAYQSALARANAVAQSTDRLTLRTAIDSLKAEYAMAMAAESKPVTEGYYYLVSDFKKFNEKGVKMAAYASDNKLGWQEADFCAPKHIFRFTAGANNSWIIQSYNTERYISTDQSGVSLTETALTGQLFSYLGGGQFSWSNLNSANTYYPNNYTGDRGIVQSATPKKALGAVDAWRLMRVPADVVDSIEMEKNALLIDHTLVVKGNTRLNWIKAQARIVGQLNIMAIDTREATLADDCTCESLLAVSSQQNCILYVGVDQNVSGANVVKDGHCLLLSLVDAPFYCPEAFEVDAAQYELAPAYATKQGGWQTVAIPFTVDAITASTTGTVNIESVTQSGGVFVREFSGIEDGVIVFDKLNEPTMTAYTPYALAVPGEQYGARSLEGQTLTFHGSSQNIQKTDDSHKVEKGNYSFVPKFDNAPVHKAWILNYQGSGFDAWTYGTPLCMRAYFTCVDEEAYSQGAFTFALDAEGNAPSKKLLTISGLSLDDDITDITDLNRMDMGISVVNGGLSVDVDRPTRVVVCSAGGQLLFSETILGQRTISLPQGVYIVNNIKILINNK